MNKVIDFHTHYVEGNFFIKNSFDASTVLADMDANNIEKNLLLPTDGFFMDSREDNDRISDIVAEYPDRFAGLGTVNPRFVNEASTELKRCLSEKNMIGFKFHPWLQAFSPLEENFMSLAEEANAAKTMFFFHDGTPPYTEPLQIAEVARRNPDLTVVMGHAGLNDLWRESLLAAQKYDNIWLCFCACPYWGMQEITNKMGGERLMWGSDYPLALREDTRDRIRQIEMLNVSDDVKERILYRNAKQLINMFKKEGK